MRRRGRRWRITIWWSLLATALLAGGAIGSRNWFGWWVDGQGRLIGFAGGSFTFGRIQSLARAGWESGTWAAERFWVEYWTNGSDWTVDISLLTLAGATFAGSTLSAIMVFRSRRRRGHCFCGYPIADLDRCPECGLNKAFIIRR